MEYLSTPQSKMYILLLILCMRSGDRSNQRSVSAAAGWNGGVIRVHVASGNTTERHRVFVRTTASSGHGQSLVTTLYCRLVS